MIKILQWNINGYTNNYHFLQILIKSKSPKIIFLQETHLTKTNNIPIPINFTLCHINSSSQSKRGVVILIHNSIQHTKLNTQSEFETIILEIILTKELISTKKFNLITTYFSPRINFATSILHNILDSHNNNNNTHNR